MLSLSEILARTASVYASCTTYMDEGTTTTDVIESPDLWPSRTVRVEFHSAFERSTGFVFSFRSFLRGPILSGPEKESSRGEFRQQRILGQDWSALQGRHFAPGHELSVMAGSDSVPGRTASVVARRLRPGAAAPFSLPAAQSARDLGEDDIDGRRCVGIHGATPAGWPVDVWIDVESFLLLRRTYHSVPEEERRQRLLSAAQQELDSARPDCKSRPFLEEKLAELKERPEPRFRMESTTVWRPQLDIEIDPASLRFEPPG